MKNIGRYNIIAELGRGAMGVVYRAADPTIGREVALKVLSLSASPEEGTNSPQEMFMREVRAAGRLAHPSIVAIHDAFDDAENHTSCIVMEMVPGVTLEKILESVPPPSIEEGLDIIRQVADGLDYAHKHQVIHRDLKPANILVTMDGRAKITDFGIAKVLAREGLARTIGVMGTPSYMSPEQVKGGEIDARSDIFSLGIILFTILCGKKPFAGNTAAVMFKIVYEEPPAPSTLNPQATPGHDHVVKKCLAKDRNQRYPSARELVEDLEDIRQGRIPRSMSGASARPSAAPPVAATGARTERPLGAPPAMMKPAPPPPPSRPAAPPPPAAPPSRPAPQPNETLLGRGFPPAPSSPAAPSASPNETLLGRGFPPIPPSPTPASPSPNETLLGRGFPPAPAAPSAPSASPNQTLLGRGFPPVPPSPPPASPHPNATMVGRGFPPPSAPASSPTNETFMGHGFPSPTPPLPPPPGGGSLKRTAPGASKGGPTFPPPGASAPPPLPGNAPRPAGVAPESRPLTGQTLSMHVPDFAAVSPAVPEPPAAGPFPPRGTKPPSPDGTLIGQGLPLATPPAQRAAPPVPAPPVSRAVPPPATGMELSGMFPATGPRPTGGGSQPLASPPAPVAAPPAAESEPVTPTEMIEAPPPVASAHKSPMLPILLVGVAAVLLAGAGLVYWGIHRSNTAPAPPQQVVVQTPPSNPAPVEAPPAETPSTPPATVAASPAAPATPVPVVVKKLTVVAARKPKQAAPTPLVAAPTPEPTPAPAPAPVAAAPTPAPAAPSPADLAKAEADRLAKIPRIIQVSCNYGLKEATFVFSAGGKTLYEEALKGKKLKGGFLGIKGSYSGTFTHTITVPAGVQEVSVRVIEKGGSTDMTKVVKMPAVGGFVPTLAVEVDSEHMNAGWKAGAAAAAPAK